MKDDERSGDIEAADGQVIKQEVPSDGNMQGKERFWTDTEKSRLYQSLKAWARWEVDYSGGFVRSTHCQRTTENRSQVCDTCEKLGEDVSLKAAVRKAQREADMPADEQHSIHVARAKYAPRTLRETEARAIQAKLKDPLVWNLWMALDRNDSTGCFLELYKQAVDGKLKGFENSAQTYGILSAQLGGPSPRCLRYVVARSPDCLQNPMLQFENVAHVKRLMDSVKYIGPVAVAGDCTKVRKRLTYSNDFGSHVLGSILPLNDCAVDDPEDIDEVIGRVKTKNAWATQTRAILVKIPLPQIPPLVIALIPTNGTDNAELIHSQQKTFLQMATTLQIQVVSLAADGASSELLAQSMMDNEAADLPRLSYEYKLYGIDISTPCFGVTGPLISLSDPQHGRKTCRNQPQHGTHTASLGRGYVVNRSLVRLYESGEAAMVLRDVENVDKQDDGAARCLFHHVALTAATTVCDGERTIKDEFTGLFVYLFIFGELIDAWLNRRLTAQDRVLAVLRARFFLHIWKAHIVALSRRFPDLYSTQRSFISPQSFNIFNRMCDSLLLLVIAYSKHYPTYAFCPWLLGTEFVEHFFGLARSLIPNFTYAEFLKLVKHVMLRQRILLSGDLTAKRERNSGAGYVLDYDASPLSSEELNNLRVDIDVTQINQLVVLAWKEASLTAKQLLRMPIPSLPIILAPLAATKQRRSPRKKRDIAEDEELDSDEVEEVDEDSESDDDSSDEEVDDSTLSKATAAAAHDTARYAALSEDYEDTLSELPVDGGELPLAVTAEVVAPPSIIASTASDPTILEAQLDAESPLMSELLDEKNKVSVSLMLAMREHHQSGTRTRSERVIMLDPKFALKRLEALDKNQPTAKLSVREGSHRVRVIQDLGDDTKRAKTAREIHWQNTAKQLQMIVPHKDVPNIASKNVSQINPLRPGCFVIMKNKKRMYIGEILDLYKKDGVGGTTDDEDVAMSDSEDDLRFSCRSQSFDLHTHAFADHLLYNLGHNVLHGKPDIMVASSHAASVWRILGKPKVQKLTIKIPGRQHTKASNTGSLPG
ncbi:hypothetical protein A0H81_08835 [Grifola frondosa]|uniref:Uncharacterized protein n=1 Tax=Grifola frondosa TaxID=5627 RepID=A0A1C7M3U3_GRIFR|nr:hypothetical protein A0H81_08835 [Grifola frondosa]